MRDVITHLIFPIVIVIIITTVNSLFSKGSNFQSHIWLFVLCLNDLPQCFDPFISPAGSLEVLQFVARVQNYMM